MTHVFENFPIVAPTVENSESCGMAEFNLEVPADLGHSTTLREAVLGLAGRLELRGLPVPQRSLEAWGLAVYEAATNVARHSGSATMALDIEGRDDAVVFRLRDGGLEHARWNDVALPEDLAEGGYGLAIIQTLMHDVSYSRKADGTNELVMVGCWPTCRKCRSAHGLD